MNKVQCRLLYTAYRKCQGCPPERESVSSSIESIARAGKFRATTIRHNVQPPKSSHFLGHQQHETPKKQNSDVTVGISIETAGPIPPTQQSPSTNLGLERMT